MRPVFDLEPKCRVTTLTREKWTRGPGTHPIVKGLVWFTNGSGMAEGTRFGRVRTQVLFYSLLSSYASFSC